MRIARGLFVAAAVLVGAWAPVATQGVDRVVRVIDGDTVVLADAGTVRLIGADSPETVDPRKPVQVFGREASAALKAMLTGQIVTVTYDQVKTDRYGRTLAYLTLADGRLVNLEIIRLGYAHAYTLFPFGRMDEFRSAEREARQAQRGLWASGNARATQPDPRLVYVSGSGGRYHTAGCRHLGTSRSSVRLDETPGHYTPCRVCRPPVLQ